MAEPLKNFYNQTFFDHFITVLQKHLPNLSKDDFLEKVRDSTWEDKELKQRIRHLAIVLHDHLPSNFTDASQKIVEMARAFRKQPIEGNIGFGYIALADYIEVYGQNHLTDAIATVEEVTQLISCEFAVRPFIEKYPDQMMAQMLVWAGHPSWKVRRLASEGSRPRLPWGIALQKFKKDPTPVFPILEKLKNDPSEDVRRSVANNLNDIAKDHPDKVLNIVQRWKTAETAEMDKLVKHACRTLLKKAHPETLKWFGFADPKNLKISKLQLSSRKISLGEKLHFSFEIQSQANQAEQLRLEYGIDYVKSNGKLSRKIFQIFEKEIRPDQIEKVKRSQLFANLTTRKHYAGFHYLAIIMNGQEISREKFELVT
jgi:3-methyladenine DNA glycosylase AlkC